MKVAIEVTKDQFVNRASETVKKKVWPRLVGDFKVKLWCILLSLFSILRKFFAVQETVYIVSNLRLGQFAYIHYIITYRNIG